MKKFGIFAAALFAAVAFTACEPQNGPEGGVDNEGVDLNSLPNGFYVSEAGVDLVEENAMDQGINEVDQKAREGMYEKYIVLEAGKKYEFGNKKGTELEKFGAALDSAQLVTEGADVAGLKGSLVANTTIEVATTALYHIVLDFNQDGNLTDVGGAQCIVVPAKWGVRGGMNGWGYTPGEQVAPNKWEWKDCTFETDGKFKFDYSGGWKIELDIAKLVKANTNLGADLVPGATDIEVKRGVYTITLEFVGPAPTTPEAYKYDIKLTKELEAVDPSKIVYSFIGTVNGNWDTDTDFAYVSNNGNHYVFEATGLDLAAGNFKIRCNHDWGKSFGGSDMTIVGVDVSGDGDITLAAAFKGSAKLEYDWDGSAETNITLTFTAAE